MIVATAGHIDHGKTPLVKALTGVDTDRLPEEKARGISIDLGFAYCTLPDGAADRLRRRARPRALRAQHARRRVRHRFRAAGGRRRRRRDAADRRAPAHPRPAATSRAAPPSSPRSTASTRRASPQVARQRRSAARRHAARRRSRAAGVGGQRRGHRRELRELLAREPRRSAARAAPASTSATPSTARSPSPAAARWSPARCSTAPWRRATSWCSRRRASRCACAASRFRARRRSRRVAGERCALNLTGADLEAVSRGDWVLAPAIHARRSASTCASACSPRETQPLKHWTPVHLHLAHRRRHGARRDPPRRGASRPAARRIVQLIARSRRSARCTATASSCATSRRARTLGGGTVLDPFAPATRRNSSARAGRTRCARTADAGGRARRTAQAVRPGRRSRALRTHVQPHARARRRALCPGRPAFSSARNSAHRALPRARHADAARAASWRALAEFHRAQPQAAGAGIEALRKRSRRISHAEAFSALLRELADARKIEVSGSSARLPGHNTTANSADEKMWQAVSPALDAAGFNAAAVARPRRRSSKLKEAIVKDFLHRKAKGGEVMRVTADRFYPRATLATLAAIAQATAQSSPTACSPRRNTATRPASAAGWRSKSSNSSTRSASPSASATRARCARISCPSSARRRCRAKPPAKAATPAKAAPQAQRPAPRMKR